MATPRTIDADIEARFAEYNDRLHDRITQAKHAFWVVGTSGLSSRLGEDIYSAGQSQLVAYLLGFPSNTRQGDPTMVSLHPFNKHVLPHIPDEKIIALYCTNMSDIGSMPRFETGLSDEWEDFRLSQPGYLRSGLEPALAAIHDKPIRVYPTVRTPGDGGIVDKVVYTPERFEYAVGKMRFEF